jgi:hypothetical protein
MKSRARRRLIARQPTAKGTFDMRLSRPISLAIALAALLGLLIWGAAMAQTDAATPPAEELEPSAYLTLDMQAGFALDPFLVSLNGGGELDASTLDPTCAGYINDRPVLTADWEGAVDFLRVFFFSDSDSTLVIQQPDGEYLCADDVDENVLDPEVVAEQPASGTYNIWVGSYEPNQLIPGLLVITARPDVDISSFDPRALVKRAPIELEIMELAAKEAVTETQRFAADGVLSAGAFITATVTAEGDVPSFEVSGEDAVCGGMIGAEPDFVVDVPADIESLRILFEAEQDTSLLAVHAEAGSFCADDDEGLLNANPVLDIEAPAPGLYSIFVGRFQEDEPITGTLTITTDPTQEPALLAPAANPQE